MSMSSPFVIVLTAVERGRAAPRGPASAAASTATWFGPGSCWRPPQGAANAVIAAELGVHVDTVRKWRDGSPATGLAGLSDRPRSGRPRRFTPVQVAEVKALACTLPAETGVAAVAVVQRGAGRRGHRAAVWSSRSRRPRCAAGWPPTRSSRGSTGPGSSPATPTSRPRPPGCWTCTTGAGTAEPLGDDDYVISADEKSQLQALRRRHPGLPPGPGRTRRVEFEYRRGGTLAYFAAYDVHRAHVIGQIAPKTGIEPFDRPRRPGDDHRAVRLGAAGVLGRRQRLLPQRAGARSTG